MTALERVEAAASSLKLFPLPSAVLLPHSVMTLHIFEPRYRALVRDALASDKVMGLAQLQPGWEPTYAGRPPMKPLACAGLIIFHEELAEGRYNILLQGVCRVRILEELAPAQPYRQARVQALPDPDHRGTEEDRLVQAVFELSSHLPSEVADSLLPAMARANGGALADLVAAAIVEDPERRQALLAELNVPRRLTSVLDDVGEMLARRQPVTPSGPLN